MAYDPFVDSIFVQMTFHYDQEGELPDRSTIPEPHRTVLLVYHCQGIIGNGGFRFLLEDEFFGDPGFELTKKAFQDIGATGALAAWNHMESIFPAKALPRDIETRLRIWESNFSRFDEDTPDSMYFESMDETGLCLRQYIDRHLVEFERFIL